MVCQWCASPRNSVTSLQPGMMSWEFSRLIELSPIISRDTTTRSSTRKQLNIDPRVVCLCLCVCGAVRWPIPRLQPSSTDRGLLGNLQTPRLLLQAVGGAGGQINISLNRVTDIFIYFFPSPKSMQLQWSGWRDLCYYWSWKMLSRENLITHN